MHRRLVAAVAFVGSALVTASGPALAQSGIANVSALANIYLAGGNAGGGDGVAPTAIALTAGMNRVLTFSSVGSAAGWSCVGGAGFSADGFNSSGGICVGPANIAASGSISSLVTPGRSMTLVGVFLDANVPAGMPPAGIDYSAAGALNRLSYGPIGLNQVFFVGDGRTTDQNFGQAQSGIVQMFAVPDAATRLYLGIADACGFSGGPSCYGDNSGFMDAAYDVRPAVASVPEPATIALLGGGLLALGGIARRRRAA